VKRDGLFALGPRSSVSGRGQRPRLQSLLLIGDRPRGRLNHFNLGAHSLDLGGLLFELGCESLYLFLLLRDRCFQLLNFANFAIEHGGAGRRAGCATRHRCFKGRGARGAKIPAKVVVRKVYSNFNNAAANRLEVIEDTTDVAL